MFGTISGFKGGIMAKKKIYAVKKGKATGIFKTWEECKTAVNGYPNAQYKGFYTEKEAVEYLAEESKSIKRLDIDTEQNFKSQIVAYVDGSYSQQLNRYAFGCVILTLNGDTIKESGYGDSPEALAVHNVAGEIMGAKHAVEWCEQNEYSAIEICYDYLGIEMWATGEWKAKNQLTKEYAEFMQDKMKKIDISFKKIAAHTGNSYNEEADRLAKAALTEGNRNSKIKKGDYWFTVENISTTDLEAILEIVEEEAAKNGLALERAEKDIAHGKSITLKLNKNDKVTISHYKEDKLVMQGKPQMLFSSVLSYIMELVEIDEIPRIFNDTYRINIDKDEIRSKFQGYMPNSYDRLPDKLSKTLHQAVYNLKLDGDVFDGTFLAQPVIRAIEAHLKMILIKLEIVPDWKYIKENHFDMFNKNGAKYELKPDRCGVAVADEVIYIGKCYTFYSHNRNVLSHWDDPTATLDTTKLLNVSGAHDLIKRTLTLIDEYYKVN